MIWTGLLLRHALKYGAAAVILAGIGLHGCRRAMHVEMPPHAVRAGTVTREDVPFFIDSFGALTSPHVVDVRPRVTGEIREIFFEEGQDVLRGDLLAEIDPREYKAKVDQAAADLEKAVVDLRIKRDTMERNRKLAGQELISSQEFDKYVSEAESAQADVAFKRAALDAAELQLEFCSIRSPVEGVAGRRQLDPGNIVSANSDPALVNIRMMDPLHVDFSVSERELARVRDAMRRESLEVRITVDGQGGGTHIGTLVFLENKVDESTGTIFLRARVPNEQRNLWPGQFVRVRMKLGVQKDALVAPASAVRLGKKGHYLFVILEDKTADLRLVSPGERGDGFVVIEKGVDDGETVVTQGQMGLAPGIPVRIVRDEAGSGARQPGGEVL